MVLLLHDALARCRIQRAQATTVGNHDKTLEPNPAAAEPLLVIVLALVVWALIIAMWPLIYAALAGW